MALYLYGIVPASTSPPGLEGVAGAAVRVLDHGDIGAVVSDLPEPDLRVRKRDVLAHSDVLQALCTDGVDVLPIRFGTSFTDESELVQALLDANAAVFTSMLADVAGKVEVQVKSTYVEEAIAAQIVASDRRIQRLKGSQSIDAQVELGRRFAESLERTRYADGKTIVDALARTAERVSVGEASGEYGVINASFLLLRSALGGFDEALAKITQDLTGRVTFRSIGPLPPYSFVDASAVVVTPWA